MTKGSGGAYAHRRDGVYHTRQDCRRGHTIPASERLRGNVATHGRSCCAECAVLGDLERQERALRMEQRRGPSYPV